MASSGDWDRRYQKPSDKTNRTALPQTSRLLAPTRSSLAKSRPDAPKSQSGETERGRRLSDASDLSGNNGRDGQRVRRSSYPDEGGGRDSRTGSEGKSPLSKSKAAGGSPGAGKGRNADSRGTYGSTGRSDRTYGDFSSPDKPSKPSPEKAGASAEKGLRGLKPLNTGTGNRVQGRASGHALAESGKLSGGEKTPTAVKRDAQFKPGMAGVATSPRGSPRAMPTSPRAKADAYPTSPRSSVTRTESGKDNSRASAGRKEKVAVQRSTLNPALRGPAHSDGFLADSKSLQSSWQNGLDGLYGEGEQWAEGALRKSFQRGPFQSSAETLDSLLEPEFSGTNRDTEFSEPLGWPAGVISRDTLLRKSKESAPGAADASTSERSSNLDEDDDGHKPGGKKDGSPVSVLEAIPSDGTHSTNSATAPDATRQVPMLQSSMQVSVWQKEQLMGQPSAGVLDRDEAVGAVQAAVRSSLSSDLLDISSLDFMGDISGMEQDLEYVRHVLLLSGFAGKVLPPVHSVTNPIHPSVFEQLEQGITTGSVEGAHDAIIIDKARQAEERRQRRLLFDAVNEALGRRLLPYYARPVWVKPSQPVIKKLPTGRLLLKEVWEEIHDWPIASSDEVYDILDDAARRDMSRGTERWVEMGQERAESAFELEKLILEGLFDEVALEFCSVESTKRERRLQAKKALKPRREVHLVR